MLYEVYASPEAFEAHWNGPAKQQANRDFEGLRVSASGARCDLVVRPRRISAHCRRIRAPKIAAGGRVVFVCSRHLGGGPAARPRHT